MDFLLMSHHFTSGLSKEACFFVEFIAVASVKVSYIQALTLQVGRSSHQAFTQPLLFIVNVE